MRHRFTAHHIDTSVRTEEERHRELLMAAQSLLELLASPQNHLYFKCSHADGSIPTFDPHDYFEVRGMIADEQTMALLHELLELYANALACIGDFSLKQKYLSAPYLTMDESLLKASTQIAELNVVFSENYEALHRFMISNKMIKDVIEFRTER